MAEPFLRKLAAILYTTVAPPPSAALARSALPVGLAVCLLLTGCEVALRDEVRTFVEENVAKCGGTVKEVVLVSDGLLTNKLTGYATVQIGAEEYKPALSVTVGIEHSLIQMDSDPCVLHQIQEPLRWLQDLFN